MGVTESIVLKKDTETSFYGGFCLDQSSEVRGMLLKEFTKYKLRAKWEEGLLRSKEEVQSRQAATERRALSENYQDLSTV